MPSRLLAVTCDAQDPTSLARFWAGVLARETVEDDDALLLAGKDEQLSVQFTPSTSEKLGLGRMHLHLTSSSLRDQQQTVGAALGLGARHIDVGQRPEEGHTVLADPEGNEFCVLGPGNAFLEGCGFLGELACDGTREVGVFWSAALGWPLVWDENDETAIQSPRGGTKIAWGGPPVAPRTSRNRQRFELSPAVGDEAEVERLVALGATLLHAGERGVVELADPGGDEFSLKLGRPPE